MIAVIFEVEITEEHAGAYMDAAASLYPLLLKTDGFISIERFQSLTQQGKILSLSFWRDEESVQRWYNQKEHKAMQRLGREKLFQNYRIRVGGIIRDYGMHEGSRTHPGLEKSNH